MIIVVMIIRMRILLMYFFEDVKRMRENIFLISIIFLYFCENVYIKNSLVFFIIF